MSRKLVLDSRNISSAENARIAVWAARKDDANPLFGEEKPWEQRFDNLYPNVIFDSDERLYKCWYSAFIVDTPAIGMALAERQSSKYVEPPENTREMGVCYATSHDGITWEKPELGIVEYEGSTKNNIVLRGPHGSGVLKDREEKDSDRRYKMLTSVPGGGMGVSFSPDGIHWSSVTLCPDINPYRVDGTHYNALWVREQNQYVGFTRLRNEQHSDAERIKKLYGAWPLRQVGRTTSSDFVKWTEAKAVMEGIDENLQIYSMPIFRHGDVFLGLPVIHEQESDQAWTELAWSPDTIEWHRVAPGSPLIPNSDLVADYDWGCAYSPAYPIFLEDEIRLYYGGSNWLHFGWRDAFLCLARLRPDGFAGFEQVSPGAPGVVTTTPLVCEGELLVSADVAAIGTLGITLLAESERRIIAESEPIHRSLTDGSVEWRDGFSADSVKGQKVRIEFSVNGARLFSYGFRS